VHHKLGIALVTKAARNLGRQPDGAIRLAQQDRAGIRRDRPTIESTHNLAPLQPFKDQS
jgi:hypothetical protein